MQCISESVNRNDADEETYLKKRKGGKRNFLFRVSAFFFFFSLPLNTSDTHSLKGLSTDLCGDLKASVQTDGGKNSGSKRGN